jgi:peptidyl-prolyl cis-trans isomerase C
MPFRPALTAAALSLALAAPLGAQEADPETVVATVNGEPITLGHIASVRADLPDQYQQLSDQALYDGILQQLIDQKLMTQAAEAAAVPDDAVVARALTIQRQSLLSDFYMRGQMRARITEERLAAAYEENYGDAAPTREIRASHILVESEEAAQALKAQLDEGADFADLAMSESGGPSGPRGGDVGWFDRSMMLRPFAEAAFDLAVGEISEPVRTDLGWHVIQVTDERERPAPTLEEVRIELARELGQAVANEVLGELREAAEIVRDEARPGLDAFRAPELTAYP